MHTSHFQPLIESEYTLSTLLGHKLAASLLKASHDLRKWGILLGQVYELVITPMYKARHDETGGSLVRSCLASVHMAASKSGCHTVITGM